jgi:hypothetical protein
VGVRGSDVLSMAAAHPFIGFDLKAFVAEVERYLDVVRIFREEGCEPHWTPEEPLAHSESAPEQMPLFVAD